MSDISIQMSDLVFGGWTRQASLNKGDRFN